jgi:cytochrome P450
MSSKFRYGDLHWLHNPKEYQEDIKIINEFISYYVDLALTKSTDRKPDTKGEKYVFLEALAAQTQDPVALRAQLLNILLAGRDTTASLLSWTFHELVRNPEIFEKLRRAILSDFGPYSTDDLSAITFSSLKSCTYLQHTLSEALRLWPVVPGNSRRSNKRTTLPRGGGPDGLSPVFIPPETQVDYSVYTMMRRKDLWGEDADKFRPERFEGRKPG